MSKKIKISVDVECEGCGEEPPPDLHVLHDPGVEDHAIHPDDIDTLQEYDPDDDDDE